MKTSSSLNILPSHFPISPLPLADFKGRREERDEERGAGSGGGVAGVGEKWGGSSTVSLGVEELSASCFYQKTNRFVLACEIILKWSFYKNPLLPCVWNNSVWDNNHIRLCKSHIFVWQRSSVSPNSIVLSWNEIVRRSDIKEGISRGWLRGNCKSGTVETTSWLGWESTHNPSSNHCVETQKTFEDVSLSLLGGPDSD